MQNGLCLFCILHFGILHSITSPMRSLLVLSLLFCSAGNFAQILDNSGFDNFGYGSDLLKFDPRAYSGVVMTMDMMTTKITFINDSLFEQRDRGIGKKQDYVRFGLVRNGNVYEYDTLNKTLKDSASLPCIEKDSGDYHVQYYCYRPKTESGTLYCRERYDAQHHRLELWRNWTASDGSYHLTQLFYSGDTVLQRTYLYHSDYMEERFTQRSILRTDTVKRCHENISPSLFSVKKYNDQAIIEDSLHLKTTWTFDKQHRINLIKDESWFNSDEKESHEESTMEIRYIERKN